MTVPDRSSAPNRASTAGELPQNRTASSTSVDVVAAGLGERPGSTRQWYSSGKLAHAPSTTQPLTIWWAATSRHALNPVEPGPTPYWYQVGRSNRFAVHSGPARSSRSVSRTSFTKTGVFAIRIDCVAPPMLTLPSSARSMIEISSAVDIDPSAAATVLWADSRSLDTSTSRQCHSADSRHRLLNDPVAKRPQADR